MRRFNREIPQIGAALCIVAACTLFAAPASASGVSYPRPPAKSNVVIENGGLAITFNIAWGGVVVSIADRNVAHGLNIVDTHDVGRELQVDQFLHLQIHGRNELMINPTQAGALGQQAFYRHPKGVIIREKGSPVVHWKATRTEFHAVIRPLDYDTGHPTYWVYRERVRIDRRAVAHFHYVFYNHGRGTYPMSSEVPTLYSDRTGTFMYPRVSPYGVPGALLKREHVKSWPVQVVSGAPRWPQRAGRSKGWIANIDSTNNIGIFYTTPMGFAEDYGTFPAAYVSGAAPLGKTNVVAKRIMARPGISYSISFSVLVSTPARGPELISQQPAANFKILHN